MSLLLTASRAAPEPPQRAVRLASPLAVRFDAAPAYRAGPSSLPSNALGGQPGIRWAAYWYHRHDHTCMTRCHCWTVTDGRVYFAFDGGGDGVLLVQHANGDVGVYSLAHTRMHGAVDWDRFVRCKGARMTAARFRVFRNDCGEQAPAFGDAETDRYTPPRGADAIWEAWDDAVRHYGIRAEPVSTEDG